MSGCQPTVGRGEPHQTTLRCGRYGQQLPRPAQRALCAPGNPAHQLVQVSQQAGVLIWGPGGSAPPRWPAHRVDRAPALPPGAPCATKEMTCTLGKTGVDHLFGCAVTHRCPRTASPASSSCTPPSAASQPVRRAPWPPPRGQSLLRPSLHCDHLSACTISRFLLDTCQGPSKRFP